jgi:hypothetical protein
VSSVLDILIRLAAAGIIGALLFMACLLAVVVDGQNDETNRRLSARVVRT